MSDVVDTSPVKTIIKDKDHERCGEGRGERDGMFFILEAIRSENRHNDGRFEKLLERVLVNALENKDMERRIDEKLCRMEESRVRDLLEAARDKIKELQVKAAA